MSKCQCSKNELCGFWENKAPLNTARENFASVSGPDKDASGTLTVDSDPRVYVIGGFGKNGEKLSSCEKYNPNTDSWSAISDLPEPLGNLNGSFVPDYGKSMLQSLGYIYVAGGDTHKLFRYNIKQDLWETFELPFTLIKPSLQYLDDVGGPFSELLQNLTGINFPPCSDGQTLWIIEGQESHYVQMDISGNIISEWIRGPDLLLKRVNPLVGRTFWRDAGITTFGVSNCATIIVAGGIDEQGQVSKDIQLLVRKNCNWTWIDKANNPSEIPDDVLTLAYPVENGAFGTEQWPETLITGGRPILFGGNPEFNFNGSVQFAQLRFIGGRYRRDPELKGSKDSAWNVTSSMPGKRVGFRAAPLSQGNSSNFGGNRVSRFLCVGGRDDQGVLDRVQLFELPTPSVSVKVKPRYSLEKRC